MIPALVLIGAVAATVAVYAAGKAGNAEPRAVHVREVTPYEAAPGDIVKASGDALDAESLMDVYLANENSETYKVEVLKQTDHWFTFRILPGTPAGKYSIAVVAKDSEHLLLEPVRVKVIEARITTGD
jgi:hypothetical protein